MKIKERIESYFYYKYVINHYNKISEGDIEELYVDKDTVVVIVKDEEVRKRLYDIIKFFCDTKHLIVTEESWYRIKKYFTDDNGGIKMFCMEYHSDDEWSSLSKVEQLQEIAYFTRYMEEKGYLLDESRFENEKCSHLSAFLSFFVPAETMQEDEQNLLYQQIVSSRACIIKYVHYLLTQGGKLNEYYEEKLSKNVVNNVMDFPYKLSIVKMCYNFYAFGKVPDNIADVLVEEEYNYRYFSIASEEDLKAKLKVLEGNEEHTIYTFNDSNIIIYHEMLPKFKQFLRKEIENIREASMFCMEKIVNVIINYDGDVIGYQFVVNREKYHNILERRHKSQHNVISNIKDIIQNSKWINNKFNLNSYQISEEEREQIHSCLDKVELYYEREVSYYNYKFRNVKDLFAIVASEDYALKEYNTKIAFKLLQKYIEGVYGILSEEHKILSCIEVRYLSPILATNFVKYVLGGKVDYESASKELYLFIEDTKKSNRTIYYDSRFEYTPSNPFAFTYEVEKEYGIKPEKNMNQQLPDGRLLITFGKYKKISDVRKEVYDRYNEITTKVCPVENLRYGSTDYSEIRHGKGGRLQLVEIFKIIYDTSIDTNGMYKVLGYITEPVKGKPITDEVLLGLDQKELLKLMAYLFSNFGYYYYIPWEYIWMDDMSVFYVNMLDVNFEVVESRKYTMVMLKDYLVQRGYNPNVFEDLELVERRRYDNEKYFLNKLNSLNAYCNEHSIYYDREEKMCPVCLKTKYFVKFGYQKNAKKVFEDAYSIHYKIDATNNLKVYKTNVVNIAEVEKNVETFISYPRIEEVIGQKGFIPHKKAMLSNKKFIGYIYNAEEFNSSADKSKKEKSEIAGIDVSIDAKMCIDIKDSEKIANLPRVMSLIRLILQVQDFVKKGWGFTLNPYTYVFLNKSYKKQVQILNIDFLSRNANVSDTLKWTCEYVNLVIAQDTSIELDISDCNTDLIAILEKLRELSQDMKGYCPIHKMYYRSHYSFCPKCVGKENMEHIKVEEVQEEEITKQKNENEGGESIIYPYKDGLVAKVFKQDKINYSLKSIVIAKVLSKSNILEGINSKNYKYNYIIPKMLLKDKSTSKIFGYVMKEVNGRPISNLRDKVQIEELGFTRKDVFEILITVGQGIETLHANNIYIGDLNGRNILFDKKKNVYFLDFDGMGVDGIAPEFCTDGYIDPVSKKTQNITMKDDWYSFAIQAFYYLTFTHPFNGIYTIKEKGKEVTLDIPDKMERGISLLGEHGMKPPAIAEPWDWMNNELTQAFLETFEGKKRENIVPELIHQYDELYKDGRSYDRVIRINPKFIAAEIVPFGENVVRILNSSCAICESKSSLYLKLLLDGGKKVREDIKLSIRSDFERVLISEDEKIIFAIYENSVIAIDLETNTQLYKDRISNPIDVIVNGRTLYYTGISEDENIIYKCEFTQNGEVQKERIRFLTKQQLKRIYVKFNSKFVLVKAALNTRNNTVNARSGGANIIGNDVSLDAYLKGNIDEIYCNSEKLCEISNKLNNPKYNILYDDATNMWLVVNEEGNGVIIKAFNGTYRKIAIKGCIDDVNVSNISFSKGIIYIPAKNCLYIINAKKVAQSKEGDANTNSGESIYAIKVDDQTKNDQTITKKMECNKIMTPNSKMYNINAEGFSVITHSKKLYEVRRS